MQSFFKKFYLPDHQIAKYALRTDSSNRKNDEQRNSPVIVIELQRFETESFFMIVGFKLKLDATEIHSHVIKFIIFCRV